MPALNRLAIIFKHLDARYLKCHLHPAEMEITNHFAEILFSSVQISVFTNYVL